MRKKKILKKQRKKSNLQSRNKIKTLLIYLCVALLFGCNNYKKFSDATVKKNPFYVYNVIPKGDTIYYGIRLEKELHLKKIDGVYHSIQNQVTKNITEFKKHKKNGKYFNYYPSGKTKEIGYFINNEKCGVFISYYENNKLESISYYSFGIKEGIWYFFDSEGKIERTETYTNGILQKN